MGWDVLRERQLPVERVSLPLDPAAHAALGRALEAAAATGDHSRVAAARAALEAQPVLTFLVRTLPPADWEELVDQHPATAEQQNRGWLWDPKTLRLPALAAAVTLDGEEPLSAAQWAELAAAGRLSWGELDELFATVITLNARPARVSLGKG